MPADVFDADAPPGDAPRSTPMRRCGELASHERCVMPCRFPDRRPIAHPWRQTGPRENASGGRDRLPRNPERLRRLFTTAATLIDDLSAAFRAGELAHALATYTHPAVLVVDDVGYLTYGTDAADISSTSSTSGTGANAR
jgi:hypothetical protein